MEIRIYKSLEHRSNGRSLFVGRVTCPDAFSYEKCIDTFRSIFGPDIVTEFLIV